MKEKEEKLSLCSKKKSRKREKVRESQGGGEDSEEWRIEEHKAI